LCDLVEKILADDLARMPHIGENHCAEIDQIGPDLLEFVVVVMSKLGFMIGVCCVDYWDHPNLPVM
jgi:hypothetical protein